MGNTNQLGKDYYNAVGTARDLTGLRNRTQIELGIVLLEIQKIHNEYEEELGSFRTFLAELHLNYRRVLKMMRNAEYILKWKVPKKYWHKYDSSILELIRKQGLNPVEILEDIEFLSYSDLLSELS